jgi:hypothetical protein
MGKGIIVEANTIDALVDKMGVPREPFMATIKRYNQLVEKGVDEDFGKDPSTPTNLRSISVMLVIILAKRSLSLLERRD